MKKTTPNDVISLGSLTTDLLQKACVANLGELSSEEGLHICCRKVNFTQMRVLNLEASYEDEKKN